MLFLSETWVEKKEWETIRRRLPKGYKWLMQEAKRDHVRGRSSGGMISGVRNNIKEIGTGEEWRREDSMVRRIEVGKQKVNVVGIYRRRGDSKGWRIVEEWMEKGKEELTIIGGDFNAWTGELGGDHWNSEKEKYERRSKHKEVDKEGRKMLGIIGEGGWTICNGCTKGDMEGEITFMGKGQTVIDYVIADEKTKEIIKSVEVGDEADSGHFPLIVEIEGQGRRVEKKRTGVNKRDKMGKWDISELTEFEGRVKEKSREFGKGGEVNERWERLKRVIGEVKREMVKEREGKVETKRGWWDEECEKSRIKLRGCIKRWRKGEMKKEDYNREHKEHGKLVRKKREEGRERYIKEVEKAIEEGREWEVINRERRKGKEINKEISIEDWTKYFQGLSGGMGYKIRGEGRRREVEMEQEEISREEVNEAINRIKRNKAAGEDGMEGESLKYGGEGVREEMWKIINLVWNGEGWPETWKTGLVAPILKKGEGKRVEDYRGVTLMPVGYKVYAEVVRKRLEEKVEELECIPHNQTGFRKEMGTMDNIYVLNYIVNRNLGRSNGKLVATFVDLKAAFPSVNRGILWKVLKERGIEDGLIERIKQLYEDTKERVKIGNRLGREFWLGRGLRQGCPLSPILFNMLIADLEERMRKRGKGGVILRNGRIYTLAYADDVVLMAEDENGMKLLMNEFEKYVREKDLRVNVEKTKVLRFRKKKDKEEMEWKMNGKCVEEVNEFCYLGYWFMYSGKQDLNVAQRVEKGGKAMGQVWGIGKRRFEDDWRKRVWLFDALVWSIVSYGVEIWGWNEIGKLESMHERYLRWTMGVDWNCPGYMLREEMGREKMVTRQRRRARNFEQKLEQGKGSKIAQTCWGLIREGERGCKRWEKGRKDAIQEGRENMGRGRDLIEAWGWRDREERWKRIRESKYNKWYKFIKREEMPKYLGRRLRYERWSRVCRFRMGEGMRECKYWLEEDERKCRVCEFECEDWEHVLDRCNGCMDGEKSVMERVIWILDENGQGERWMNELEDLRKKRTEGLI
ncbi:uncharacterized protein LOC127281899 [Leptopilina boulardi]|uniref:uncharacterized protein LOC127281899 n=1 Tax=Leptopilina boulardi TaxID=63433 RepID=UPI0021F65A96|nr:uncharacterized protein LOC127281899 [Leptopilina boulardi]